ncbi:Nitroreductase-like protein [Leptodontidium sp. 2 PMI_412]|nr:Nitroreductase-like protein [Leptodontidium sp. 2 PMI_412]
MDIVHQTTLHVPSSFNSQSTRFLVLLNSEHRRLWDSAREIMSGVLPEDVFATYFAPMITKYRTGYGTILCFENQSTISAVAKQYEGIISREKFEQWSEQSAGMHQFALWCALEAEGLGANLQHYNPHIDQMVKETWDEKETKPLSERVLVRGISS